MSGRTVFLLFAGTFLHLSLVLGNAGVSLRSEAPSCSPQQSSRVQQTTNASEFRTPVALRPGQGTTSRTLGQREAPGAMSSSTATDSLAKLKSRVQTSTRQKRRTFFWEKGEEPPAEKALNQEDMVMLQGFDWKLLSDRKQLYRQLAAEMQPLGAAGVKAVWFPPPSESADPQGYLPGRWYVIGNRTLLDAAISAAHANGIVPMVDVVLNHRTAARISPNSSDWTDFEGPDWGEWAIVKDDWKCPPDEQEKSCPDNCTCGEADTGENACYAPDVDHTNPLVQADVIEWMRWLRSDVGFDAFRFDNTKGFAGKYVEQYIQATDPVYTVAEYYDSNRNLVTGWLDSSNRSSAVFDFGLRYKLKESVKHDDFSLLMDEWMGPMLWYEQESAVTFTDNHDTAGDHHFEVSDHFGTPNQVAAGYAMILSHPSRPCIFWQDWMGPNRQIITQLLAARQRAQVSPKSQWTLVDGRKGLYAAFIGDNLAVKLGADSWDPNAGLSKPVWLLTASGDVADVPPKSPVEKRVVPGGQRVLLDESFDTQGKEHEPIKARVTAFCPQDADGTAETNVTIRAFAADADWPWFASNDTDRLQVRGGLTLHWAVAFQSSAEWGRPPDAMVPDGPHAWRVDDAAQIYFLGALTDPGEAEGWEALAPTVVEVRLTVPVGVRAMQFVLKHPAHGEEGEETWYKADGDFHRPSSDFHIRMPRKREGPFWSVWERVPDPETAATEQARAKVVTATTI